VPVRFTCPHCGLATDVSEEYLGRSGPCAQCGKTVTVAAAGAMHPCPQCGAATAPGPAACSACGWRFAAAEPSGGLGDDTLTRMLIPVGRSALAIAAGYAGLFAILFLPAPLALLLGILAIRDLRKHPEKHGMGRAIFGLVSGALFTTLIVVFLVLAILEG
jgi:predicted RNA-binding Zn-ribbon protein involved in translation (DUF1610 family)